jgi:N-acetylglucosamine kinase-like BadF-type ATPase
MFGEEGGGDRIASRVIRICYDELFRLGEKSSITPEILNLFEIANPYLLVDVIYEKYYTQKITSREIINILFKCANQGDIVAQNLLKSLGVEFAKSIAGCISHLDFDSHVDISLVGSVTLKASSTLMIDELVKTLPVLTNKTHRFIPATVSPVSGAVIWAFERLTQAPASVLFRERVIKELSSI